MRLSGKVDLNKAAKYAVVLNALQIAAAVTAVCLALTQDAALLRGITGKSLLIALALVVIWGAVVDIREAVAAKDVDRNSDMVREAYRQTEELNNTLRAQRHDFLNHMQVVYTLMELEEYGEGKVYLEKVYSDLKKTSRSLKTAHPAVNALIAAKYADCEQKGISFQTDILSSLDNSPIPAWELCRVFGNLIDNAIDAAKGVSDAYVAFGTSEDIRQYICYVENNGSPIPADAMKRIFESGYSTKGAGRGLGLGIVRSIVEGRGGIINVTSTPENTRFTVTVPKERHGGTEAETHE